MGFCWKIQKKTQVTAHTDAQCQAWSVRCKLLVIHSWSILVTPWPESVAFAPKAPLGRCRPSPSEPGFLGGWGNQWAAGGFASQLKTQEVAGGFSLQVCKLSLPWNQKFHTSVGTMFTYIFTIWPLETMAGGSTGPLGQWMSSPKERNPLVQRPFAGALLVAGATGTHGSPLPVASSDEFSGFGFLGKSTIIGLV